MNHLKNLKSKKKTFYIFSKTFRKASVIIAYYLDKLWVYPNQVTLFRVFVFWWISLFLFYSENYIMNIIWIFVIFLCYFFDLVDWDLARNHDKKSLVGKFLDENLDSVILNLIIFFFIIKFYDFWYDKIYVIWWCFALFWTIMSSKMTNFFENKFEISCTEWNSKIEEFLEDNKLDAISTFFYWLITPKTFLISLLSNFRYYLLFWIIFKQIHIAVWLFSIAINIRWVLLFIFIVFYYKSLSRDNHKTKIFQLLNKIKK